MDAISAILKFFVPGLLALALCFTFVFIFTRKGSKLRNWVLATPNRTGSVGVGALLGAVFLEILPHLFEQTVDYGGTAALVLATSPETPL